MEAHSLLQQAVLHEVVPKSWQENGAAIGFIAAVTHMQNGPCLWVQAEASYGDTGWPFGAGLHAFGVNPNRVMMMRTTKDNDLLAALEEGLTTPELAAVIGVLPATSKAYDLTASRRLALRAQKYGVSAFLMRFGRGLNASATYHRWQIKSAPSSLINKNISKAKEPFIPRWHVSLTKSRTHPPARWEMEWNHETHSLCVDASSADRTAEAAYARSA